MKVFDFKFTLAAAALFVLLAVIVAAVSRDFVKAGLWLGVGVICLVSANISHIIRFIRRG